MLTQFLAGFAVIMMSKPLFADIKINCSSEKNSEFIAQFENYLIQLNLKKNLTSQIKNKNQIIITLATPENDTNTLNLNQRAEFGIENEVVYLPVKNNLFREVTTVSKKEILLALLQHGRTTEFTGDFCNFEKLQQNIEIRQNIVAWTENLSWVWPDGDPAFWNKKFWKKGTPVKGVKLTDAYNDMFFNQKKYSIGCYTASKIVYGHAILDYFNRIKKNSVMLHEIEKRLLGEDKEPLVGIEPSEMWSFEHDFDAKKINVPGKILTIQRQVAPKNFVPGDWAYLLNTDEKTYRKTGYEGSNAIYLGRNRFDDYYNDKAAHSYSYEEKMFEVYQWRNNVFSLSRHKNRIKEIPESVKAKMDLSPQQGGQVLDFRTMPYLF